MKSTLVLLGLMSALLTSCGGGGGDSASLAVADKKAPSVILSQPADGASSYGKTQVIRLTFDEAVDTDSATLVELVSLSGDKISGTIKIENGNMLVFSPSKPLTENQIYSLRAIGIKDKAGNIFNADESSVHFRASAIQDAASPYVVNTYPNNGSQADIATTIRLEFSEKVQIGSATVTVKNLANNTAVGVLKKELSRDGRFVDIHLSETLLYGRTYSVEVSGVYDLSGLMAQASNFRFSTTSTIDNVAPSVLSYVAQPGYISIKFNKPVKTKSSLTKQKVRSVVVSSSKFATSVISAEDSPTQLVGDGREILIFPQNGNLFNSGSHTVNLGGYLTGMNNQAVSFSQTLSVPDATPSPLTVKYLNANTNTLGTNASILLEFSSPVLDGLQAGSAENPNYVSLTRDTQQIPVNLNLSADGKLLTIEPPSGLTAGQTYTLVLGEIKSIKGDLFIPPQQPKNLVVRFQDLTPPTVKSTSPQDKATVSQGAIINVIFDEPVKRGSFLNGSAENRTNVKLTVGNNLEVATRLKLSDDGTVLRIEPLALIGDQSYTLSIDGVFDVSGNRQLTGKKIQLTTTTSTDTNRPTYLGANIENNSEIQNAQGIELYFNEPILPYGIALTVVDQSGLAADVSWAQTDNGKTIRINAPSNGYLLNKNYDITVSGLSDLSGNAINQNVELRFITTNASDEQEPLVVATYPFDQNKTTVNTKEDYVIWFDETIKLSPTATAMLILLGNQTEQSLAIELASDRALRIKAPLGGLQTNGSYALLVNGITDNANNLADSIDIRFTASGVTVSTSVQSTMLKQNPIFAIANNEPIEIVFKEPINEASAAASMRNLNNNIAVPVQFTLNETKTHMLLTTNGTWPPAQIRLELTGIKSRLSGLYMNGIYAKPALSTTKPDGVLVADFTVSTATIPNWQTLTTLTANKTTSLQAVFSTPVVSPIKGTVMRLEGTASQAIGSIKTLLRADRKTLDIILPSQTESRQTYTLSNWSAIKMDGSSSALPSLSFKVIDTIPTLNLFYHKAPNGNTPSNFRFSFDIDDFSRRNLTEKITLKAECTGSGTSDACKAIPNTTDTLNYAYSWGQFTDIASSAWTANYDQNKPFTTNNSSQYSISISSTDVLLNHGENANKTTYLTETSTTETPQNQTPFGRLYRPYLTTVPTSYGIDQIVLIGGSSYAQLTVGSTAITTSTTSSSAIYTSLDGGATWKKIGDIPTTGTFKGGVAGINIKGQNYITAVIGNALKYTTIASSSIGEWADTGIALNKLGQWDDQINKYTTPASISTGEWDGEWEFGATTGWATAPNPYLRSARYRATVVPDNWSEPHIGKIVMVASAANGVEYVRMTSSSAINRWEQGSSQFVGGPQNQHGFSINMMLSVGISTSTTQPATTLYMMGDDEYLWLSTDMGTTWSGRAGLQSIPKVTIPYYCHSTYSSGGTTSVGCATKTNSPGNPSTATAKFDAMGDIIADSKGNLIVMGLVGEDTRGLHYQFMLEKDAVNWVSQNTQCTTRPPTTGFSFDSLYRDGGSLIRFRMGTENAMLVVGGRPSESTYNENSVEDLSKYVLRAFEIQNYCKLGVPAVRKLDLTTF